jgi:hypothetical protein
MKTITFRNGDINIEVDVHLFNAMKNDTYSDSYFRILDNIVDDASEDVVITTWADLLWSSSKIDACDFKALMVKVPDELPVSDEPKSCNGPTCSCCNDDDDDFELDLSLAENRSSDMHDDMHDAFAYAMSMANASILDKDDAVFVSLDELFGAKDNSKHDVVLDIGVVNSQDIIENKNLNYAQGQILSTIWCVKGKSYEETIKSMQKVIWFAEREISRCKRREREGCDGEEHY